jgi:hypothetical protein
MEARRVRAHKTTGIAINTVLKASRNGSRPWSYSARVNMTNRITA